MVIICQTWVSREKIEFWPDFSKVTAEILSLMFILGKCLHSSKFRPISALIVVLKLLLKVFALAIR